MYILKHSLKVILFLLFYLNKLYCIYLKKYHIQKKYHILIQNSEVYIVKNLLSPLCSSHLFLIL